MWVGLQCVIVASGHFMEWGNRSFQGQQNAADAAQDPERLARLFAMPQVGKTFSHDRAHLLFQ